MPIVSTTMCYPNPEAPTQGVFIERRLRAIHRLMPVRVIAPVPWFPLVRPVRFDAEGGGAVGAPRVRWQRMFYVPGILKHGDARFYASALRRALSASDEDEPPRLIDAHFVWPDGVGAWQFARDRRLPFVCTIRGKLVSQIAHRSKRRQIVEMLRGADALIAVSRSLAELANDVAGTDLGIHVIPNGVDRTVFHRTSENSESRTQSEVSPPPLEGMGHPGGVSLRDRLGRPDDERYVISVGHLQTLKGFHRLVEIWPEVRRRVGDARLILVGGEAGEPDYVRRLTAQVESVNAQSTPGTGTVWVPRAACPPVSTLAASCQWHPPIKLDKYPSLGGGSPVIELVGRQSPETVARLLNAADLFVLASRSEGWCNAIAEALACGCPVVATDVGGNREIIDRPELGRLVPLDDRHALIDAICTALGEDWNRDRIAEIGDRRDWQQVARECVDVFESVLNRA